jgi:uncharacterized membrane protein YphA (DoxX/SURF4 family)
MATSTAEMPQSTPCRKVVPDAVAFALSGIALFTLVLDEIDVPHDNLQHVGILGTGGVVGVLVGTIVAWRSPSAESKERLARLAWDAVRLAVGFEMVRYGVAKVVGMQFYPHYDRWDRSVIELPPASLAWAFFGRAYAYQAAGGFAEVVGGILVCFRRTTLIGACVAAIAMANAVLVNFSYDVGVKLMSSVDLGLLLSLIVRDSPRLLALVLPRQAGSEARWTRIATASVVALAIVFPTGEILHQASAYGVFHRDLLEGIWSVDDCQGVDGAGQCGWTRLYFLKGSRNAAGNIVHNTGIVRASDGRHPFEDQVDESSRKLRLFLHGADAPPLEGDFDLKGNQLHVEGIVDGRPFHYTLTRQFPN